MNKLKVQRVLIKDNKGNFYRICNISNPKDRYGEYYVKLIFPEFRGVPLLGETNDKYGGVLHVEFVPDGIQEFTYHYKSGVSHFKSSSDEYSDQKKNLPKLGDFKGLHLLRFTIFSLDYFEYYPSNKICRGDLVLKHKFNGLPRVFEMALFADPRIIHINVSKDRSLANYDWEIDEKGVYFSISDMEYKKNPKDNKYVTKLFRYDDPVLFLHR